MRGTRSPDVSWAYLPKGTLFSSQFESQSIYLIVAAII